MKTFSSVIASLILVMAFITPGIAQQKSNDLNDINGLWIGKAQNESDKDIVTLSLQPANGKFTAELTCALWFTNKTTFGDVHLSSGELWFSFDLVDERGEFTTVSMNLIVSQNEMSVKWKSDRDDYGFINLKSQKTPTSLTMEL